MNTNFITPIQVPESLGTLNRADNAGRKDNDSLFKDIFQNMVNTAEEAETNLEQKEYLLATGQLDDAHTVTVAASQAQLAVDMLVQMRNKAVDAYNELMRISM